MHTEETIKTSLVWYMSDGNLGGGLDLYWTRGAKVVICQEWLYNASGCTYDMVYPDPMVGANLVEYYEQAIKGRTVSVGQEQNRELVFTDARIFD